MAPVVPEEENMPENPGLDRYLEWCDTHCYHCGVKLPEECSCWDEVEATPLVELPDEVWAIRHEQIGYGVTQWMAEKAEEVARERAVEEVRRRRAAGDPILVAALPDDPFDGIAATTP